MSEKETLNVVVTFTELGLVEGYGCPHCKTDGQPSPVKLDHVDDIGTKFFRCEKCGHQSTRLKSKQRLALEREVKRYDAFKTSVEKAARYFEADVSGSTRFIPKLLADEILERNTFATMMDNEELYLYLDGFYQPLGEVTVRMEVRDALEAEYSRSRAAEVLEYVKVSSYRQRSEEPPNFIPLLNGVLDLDRMQLSKYSPERLFFQKLPVPYDPDAKCPKILKFLQEVTNGQDDVDILLESIGYCLWRDYFLAKSLLLVGEGANGKSTFLSLVKSLLGAENISSRSLQELEENRFAKSSLQYKLANVYADLPDKALFKTGTFKMLTGRDTISAERKFQQGFSYVNYAKLMFSANKVPEAYDDTSAFFRRWIILVFPKTFSEDKADPHILDKLTTKEELSGLLNLALEGLKRIQENGQFSHSKTTEEIKEDYIRKSSPIGSFVMDRLEVSSDDWIPKKTLYAGFTAYCREMNLPMVTEATFFKNLSQYVAVTDYKPEVKGKRVYAFRGVRFASRMSKDFPTLIKLAEEDSQSTTAGNNKIGKTIDTLDTLDADSLTFICSVCHKELPYSQMSQKLGKPTCKRCAGED